MPIKALLLITFFFLAFLLFVSQSQAASDYAIAKKTLSAHKTSAKQVSRLSFSAAEAQPIKEEVACLIDLLVDIESSSMSEEDIEAWDLTTYFIGIVDFYRGVMTEKKGFFQKQMKVLSAKSKRLKNKSSSNKGRRIALSLSGHSGFTRLLFQAPALDMCAVRERVIDLGGVSYDNLNSAYVQEMGDGVDWWNSFFQQSEKYDKRLANGQSAMLSVRPKVSRAKIREYGNSIVNYINSEPFETSTRSFSGLPSLKNPKAFVGSERPLKID